LFAASLPELIKRARYYSDFRFDATMNFLNEKGEGFIPVGMKPSPF
jgi:hypothetical protein